MNKSEKRGMTGLRNTGLASTREKVGEEKSAVIITENDISVESGYIFTEEDVKCELAKRDERQKVEFVSDFPRAFKSKLLVEVAKISERPLDILQTLIYRGEWRWLIELLQFYGRGNSDKPYPVVDLIENTIGGDENRKNEILMMLSEMANKSAGIVEDDRIVRHEADMLALKKTERRLKDYQSLLGINQEEMNALSGKNLLIIGGGFSPIKRELENMGITCNVTNIDPLAKESSEYSDVVVSEDFFDVDIGEAQYDEVWALFSLPDYAFKPEQVRDFYIRSILALKQGGNLRVGPVNNFKDSFTLAMRFSRRPVSAASEMFLKELGRSGGLFNLRMNRTDHKMDEESLIHVDCAKITVTGDSGSVEKFFHDLSR